MIVVLFLPIFLYCTAIEASFFTSAYRNDVPANVCSGCSEQLMYCEPLTTTHTFLWRRPIYRNIAARMNGWHDIEVNYTLPDTMGAQTYVLYQKSMHSGSINSYFLMDKKEYLQVKGDAVILNNPALRDVRAEWLGLSSNFSDTLSLHPSERQTCVVFEAKYDLHTLINHPFFERLWTGIFLPFQIVHSSVGIKTQNTSSAGASFTTLQQALNNPSYYYAKFGNAQHSAGAAEINIKLGTKFLDYDDFQLSFYSLFLMPLHTNASAQYVMGPIIGNNRHFGVGSGLSAQLPINIPCQTLISFVFQAETIYFFKNNQYRTFDLKLKPWSRYMLFNSIYGQTNIPGPQILTLKSTVKPYNMIEAVGALRYDTGCLQAECGYHVWARGRETLSLVDHFAPDYGIASNNSAPIGNSNVYPTASLSTIAFLSATDTDRLTEQPIFIPIRAQDIEFETGCAPAGLSHMAFASFCYTLFFESCELVIAAGAYTEIPQYRTSMATWGVWGKLACAL